MRYIAAHLWVASSLSKVADFNFPHLHFGPPLAVTQFEFRGDLGCQKTGVHVLSCGVVCVILRLAVLIQYQRVTDTHTSRNV